MKRLIILTAIFLISFSGISQTPEIDSLTLQLSFQKPDTTKVDISIRLIESFYNIGEYKKAQSYIGETGKLASNLQYQKGIADIKYLKARIYMQKDDYYNALDYFDKSLRIYQQLNDFLGISKVNNSIGLVEIKRGNYTKGLRHSLSAIVREQLNDIEGIKNSTRNIAELYAIQNQHRKSVDYYERTLKLLDSKTDRTLRASILPMLGQQHLNLDQLKSAEKYLVQSLNLNRRIKSKKGTLKTLNSIADLNLREERVVTAERQIKEAYGIAKEIGDDNELLANYKLRITLDSLKRDYKQVSRWQTRYYELREDLRIKNTIPSIVTHIENPEEKETPKEEIVSKLVTETPSLLTKKANSSSIFKNSTYLLYGLISALVLLLITICVGVLSLRKAKNSSRKLEVKYKKLRSHSDTTEKQVSQLQDTNSVKDRLFSIVSHDLKDSITSVKAFLDLLKDKSISKKEFEELIPELSDNADNAAALLMNLLNWSKSQMQNLDPEPEAFNIQDIFKEKITLIQKKADQKQIMILDESHKDIVFADKSMIEIVIQNLLANAVKFSKVGDVITLSNRQRNGNSLICIEDTGVGISKENQDKLFKNKGFTTRGTDHEKGTGLGLSICKQLVELNKGKIWVESEPNLGSRFYIELLKSEAIHQYFKSIEVNSPIVVKTSQP